MDAAALRAAAGGAAELALPLLLHPGSGSTTLVQHSRLNVTLSEAAHFSLLAQAGGITRSYDIVAVEPLSERAFTHACTVVDCDVICFDLARRLPFRLRPPTMRAALARGVVFELCYAPALREPAARRQLLANALALTRATGGAGIIVSSGALRAFELRGPFDVANLSTLYGLAPAAAKEAVSLRLHAVLEHARSRKAVSGVRVWAANDGAVEA